MDPEQLRQILERSRAALSRGARPIDIDAFILDETNGEFADFDSFKASPSIRSLLEGEAREGRDSNRIRGRDLLRSAAQGATFGFADEIAGIGAAIVPGGRGFAEAREELQANEERFRLNHPRAAALSELGGAIASSFIPGGAAAAIGRGGRAAATAGRAARPALRTAIGRSAVAGAAGAGVEAVGRAEGGLGERLAAVPSAATVGAVVGGAFPVAGRAIGGVARRTRDIVAPARAAARLAEERLGSAVATRPGGVPAARQALEEIEQVRPGQATLADVSPETQGLLDVAVSAGPRAAERAEAQLGRRQAGQAGRLVRDIEELAGGPPNVRQAVQDHAGELAQLGRRLYEPLERAFPRIEASGAARAPRGAAGAGRFISRAQSNRIRDFLGRPVIARAFRVVNAIESMINPRAGVPSFKQLQDVRIKLGRAADRLFASGDRRGARDFREAGRQLTDLMEETIPGFRSANRQYARLATVGDALEAGQRAWKRAPAEIAEEIAEFQRRGGTRAADSFRLSMIDGLIDDLRGVASNRNVSRKFTQPSLDFAEQLRMAFPDDDVLGELLRRADIENLFAKTAGAGGNSATARRLAAFEELTGGQDLFTSVAGGAVRGGAVGATGAALGQAAQVVTGGPRRLLPQIAERLGEALTLTERTGLFELLERLERQQVQLALRLDRARLVGATTGALVGREAAAPPGESRVGTLFQ